MKNNYIDVKPEVVAYLERIGYSGPLDVSLNTLSKLQECHLHTVPYENFDILKRIPLSLKVPDLFDKIVVRHRGGYCFELNALFSWLLRELGYPVIDYFSRFWRDEPNTPPKRRHHVLQVEAEGELYLCDVGVGGIVPRKPIQMVENLVHEQGDEYYQLERDAYYGWMLYEKKRGQWSKIYSFTEEPQLPKDYIMASYWCENAPESIFINEAMVAIRTAEGRNSIAGKEFRIFTADGVQAFTPQTQEEYDEALKTYFGIVIR
ncbi:arylamine N-acetyltransferase family protein [Bacillus sp. FSL K6-3431]|uniref:arylamine N-acetyltransferase family protein n=1 Tax=Bacillus sp. FSL K6-3431 TaxID=2921500 RepID=UPI0030FA196B